MNSANAGLLLLHRGTKCCLEHLPFLDLHSSQGCGGLSTCQLGLVFSVYNRKILKTIGVYNIKFYFSLV